MRRITIVLACLSLLLVPLLTRADGSDLVQAGSRGDGKKIPNEYIVTLRDDADVDAVAGKLGRKFGGEVHHLYKNALKGFAMHLSDDQVQALGSDSSVLRVEQDEEVSILGKAAGPLVVTQSMPTGVDRINAEGKIGGGEVAVIDTGIDYTHPDLAGMVLGGKNCVAGNTSYMDGNGHGTHVSGTIAALNNGIGVVGVAPGTKLWAVRVLNNQGSGTWSQVICGIDWVTQKAKSDLNLRVASMSLGGAGSAGTSCSSSAMRQAICNSVAAGVTYVVAAGNGDSTGHGVDLAGSVPAAYPEVIAVTALADSDGKACGSGAATGYGADDTFASFSNYAVSAVDRARTIGAPGVSILSTWKGGGYNRISGTSMATPHVSGAAALYMKDHPTATPADVKAALLATTEPGNVSFGTDACASGKSHVGTTLHPEGVLRAETF